MSDEIKEQQALVDKLRDDLREAKSKLKALKDAEFERKNGLVKNKTMLVSNNGKIFHIYAGIDDAHGRWLRGFLIKKDGTVSKTTARLYNDWIKTDENR